MKILLVNTLYYPYKVGGAEKSVQALAEEFYSLGMHVGVMTLGEKDEIDQINDIHIWRLKIENIYWPFNNQNKNFINKSRWHVKDINNKGYDQKIKNILKSFNPDILFTNNLSGFSTRVWQLAKNNDIKIVHTLRDFYLQCPKTTKYKNDSICDTMCLDCKILTNFKKKNSKKVDFVVGISDFILQDHLKQGYFQDVSNDVIFNGFRFEYEYSKFKFLREDDITFGYIGQINKEKGVEVMLKSFLTIQNKDKWRLLIAGNIGKDYLNKLKNINNSDNINYLGYVDSNEFFNKIDILITPSIWNEPFGRVVLEAIIHNKMVITSKNGGISEIMINNKDFTFNSNKKDLSRLINQIIKNREKLLFKTNSEFMSKYKIENVALKYQRIFLGLINKKALNLSNKHNNIK